MSTFAAKGSDIAFATVAGAPFFAVATLSLWRFPTRTVFCANVLASLGVLYGAQLLLVPREAHRERLLEVFRLRRAGIAAYPVSYPQAFYAGEMTLLEVSGKRVLPLGGVPHVTTVYCREADPFLVYLSDRYGFNNADSVWNSLGGVALVGDSYTQGACVPAAGHFAAALRTRGPVINLGMGGNGPLSELATLREFGRLARPSVVFWLVTSNDVVRRPGDHGPSDLQLELSRNAVLIAYLDDPHFTQGVAAMGDKLAVAHRAAVDSVYQARQPEALRLSRAWSWWGRAAQFVTLRHLAALFIAPRDRARPEPPTGIERRQLLDTFRRTLAAGRREVSAWGGRLEIVYLPDIGDVIGIPDPIPDAVIRAAREAMIPVVDLRPDFSGSSRNNLFAYGAAGGHYSVQGYQIVTRALRARAAHP